MRYVVLPQAVRRVIPPLLNDFIGLQKDTALRQRSSGVVEVFSARADRPVGRRSTSRPTSWPRVMLPRVITIPMARFIDWLVARDRRRAGAERW